MCAPTPKVFSDESTKSSEISQPSQANEDRSPPLSQPSSSYDEFVKSTPLSSDHLLQKRDYQNNITKSDTAGVDVIHQRTEHGKLRRARDKFLSYLRQKNGVILTAAVAVLFFNTSGWLGCYSLLFVSLQAEFGRNATETGWVGSLAFITNCICSPFVDFLLRRFSNRQVCALGTLSCSVGLLSTSFMPKLYYLFFTYGFLFGLGSGLVFKSSMDLLLNYFPEKCGCVSSLVLTGSTVGTFVWTPINSALIDSLGWRNMCRISAAVILVICSLACIPLAAPSTVAQSDCKECDGDESDYAKSPKKVSEKDEIKWSPPKEKRMLRLPQAWLFGLASLASFTSMGFYFVNFMSYTTSRGFTSHQGSTALTITAASEAGCKLAFAAFVDKLPFRKLHLLAALSLVSTAITLSCAIVSSFPILIVVAVGSGLVKASNNCLPFSVGMEIFGPKRSKDSNSLIIFSAGVGTIISPFAISGTFDASGSYDIAVYLCSAFFLLTAIFYCLIPLVSKLYKVIGVKVKIDKVTGMAHMVPVVEDEVFFIEELVTVV